MLQKKNNEVTDNVINVVLQVSTSPVMSSHVAKNLSNVKDEVQRGGKSLMNENILLGK